MFQDRRSYQRVSPSSPQLVLLDESKYSLLFDLCEGGLAVEGFAADKSLEQFSLEFDLPAGNGCIQAKAEIVWKSDSGYRTGFRFVELADDHRQQLRAWISSDLVAHSSVSEDESRHLPLVWDTPGDVLEPISTRDASVEKHASAPVLFPLSPAPKFGPSDAERSEHLDEQRAPAYTPLILLAIVMCSIAFLMGYYWRGTRTHSRLPQGPVATTPKEVPPSPAPLLNSTKPPQPASPTPTTLDQPGFVLQVAAMKEESNADKLSASLRQRKLPAFVFKRGSEYLYKVVVGPVLSKEAAVQIQGQLERQGFQPLLKPWSPE